MAMFRSALSMSRVRALIGLRRLRLCILYRMPLLESDLGEKEMFLFLYTYIEWLERLSILPLTKVQVAVKDFPFEFPWAIHGTEWMKDFRDQFAADLQDVLLDPRGAENYAED